jgi:hypothetical protein
MRYLQPSWYQALERTLLQYWELEATAAIAIVVVTLALLVARKPVPLAIWLTYLVMP